MKFKRLSAEYIAGFFDGEGCLLFATLKRKLAGGRTEVYYHPRALIGQKYRRVLDRIQNSLKLGKVYPVGRHFRFRIYGAEGVIKFLETIQGRVIVKHTQVELMLKTLKSGLEQKSLKKAYRKLQQLKRERT